MTSSSGLCALALGAALLGCSAAHAAEPTPARPDVCKLKRVPDDAEVSPTHGFDLVFYPSTLPRGYSGCQKTWIGDGDDRASMKLLSTAVFVDGRLQRLTGHEPKRGRVRCVYRKGVVVPKESLDPAQCPPAADLEPR